MFILDRQRNTQRERKRERQRLEPEDLEQPDKQLRPPLSPSPPTYVWGAGIVSDL